MSIQISKLDFDPADPTANQRVGSFLIGAAGAVITETGTALNVNIASSTGLGIYAEDAASVSGDLGQPALAKRQDVVAIDTSADGDYSFIKVNAKGELYTIDQDANALLVTMVAETTSIDATLIALSKAEDAAHTSGDQGVMALVVRHDAGGTLVSADGDYSPLQVDAAGLLRTSAQVTGTVADDAADTGNPIKVGGRALTTATALAAVSGANDRFDLAADLYRQLFVRDSHDVAWKVSGATVGATAAQVAATPLAARKTVMIQNISDKSVWLGFDATVDISGAARGIEIPKNASMEFKFGAALQLWAISSAAGKAITILEAA